MTPAERALLLAVAKELKDRFDVLHTLIAAVEEEAAPKADLSGMDRIIANTTADEIASMVEAANDAELLGLLDRIKALEEAYDQLQEHRSRDLDELTAERDEALAKIENACQAASETHRSWMHRCHAVLAALRLDFGDPDFEMPDEARRGARLQAERDEAHEAVRRLAGVLEEYHHEHQCMAVYATDASCDCSWKDAKKALADPVVRRIVEGE